MNKIAILLISSGLFLTADPYVSAAEWEQRSEYLIGGVQQTRPERLSDESNPKYLGSTILSEEPYRLFAIRSDKAVRQLLEGTQSYGIYYPEPNTVFAIDRYYPEARSRNVDSFDLADLASLKSELCDINELTFVDFGQLSPNYDRILSFLFGTYLGTIRTLDFSDTTNFDVDRFLMQLVTKNKTLRSLTHIKASNTNLTLATLTTLRDQIQFDWPLVRDMSVISGRTGQNVAQIHVEMRGTSVMRAGFSDKVNLQKPTDRFFNIVYRASNDISTAHLQLVFE